ncbi:MAG: hypothetical protein LQ338_004113 [Usnochroma carphineum]|nr:MAG: hypothetical protein LQ338_004113 [Usnochroma carphineum]
MSSVEQETNNAMGAPLSAKSKTLESGAAMVQNFAPVKGICAHLNAFHIYANEPDRCVESNHYCTHLNEDVRQCIIYDTPEANARLIGVEYMISPRLYATLDASERKLWHSHVYEVKSGMLIMPSPPGMPNGLWEVAETKEMEDVVGLYGKTYHFWQVDRGDKLPLGEAMLMGSLTKEGQGGEGLKKAWKERDERFGVDTQQKREKRQGIEEPEVHPDADQAWKK